MGADPVAHSAHVGRAPAAATARVQEQQATFGVGALVQVGAAVAGEGVDGGAGDPAERFGGAGRGVGWPGEGAVGGEVLVERGRVVGGDRLVADYGQGDGA